MRASWFESKEKITLWHNPEYRGADIPDEFTNRSADKDIPLSQLYGFESTDKLNAKEHGDQVLSIAVKMKANMWNGDPIVVTRTTDGYMILDGHHRFAAAKKAGLESLPAIVVDASELEHRNDIPKAKVEEASGYIPTKAQAKDPRFSSALTVDVKPGETQRQAAKLGMKIDKKGSPPLLHATAAKNTSANKAYNLGLVESLQAKYDAIKSSNVNESVNEVSKEEFDAIQNGYVDIEFDKKWWPLSSDYPLIKHIGEAIGATSWTSWGKVGVPWSETEMIGGSGTYMLKGDFGHILLDASKSFRPDKIIMSQISTSKRGGSVGSKVMNAIKQYVDQKNLPFTVYKVTNVPFFKKFSWLTQTDSGTFVYDPTKNESINEALNEGYKLQLERDADMMVLNITDTATGKRTEVRGKPGYETDGYDPKDKLHHLLDKIGRSASVSDMMNGDVVTINPKHPTGASAKAATDTAFNEDVNIDNKEGWGAVSNNQEVDYFGMRVKMKPSVFLKLAESRRGVPAVDKVINHIKNGGAIGAPFLIISYTQGSPAEIIGHEGRSRMIAIQQVFGDIPVEVHLFFNSDTVNRARHLTPDIVADINKTMMSQDDQELSGPFFTESINEKITKRTPMGDVIDDFYQSDAPQFKGKSKAKRRQMAIAAKLSKMDENFADGKKKIQEALDKPTPSIKQLSKKHNVDKDDIISQVKKGVKVELEHTSDPKIALEIALDHINELPDYYDRLETVEENFADGKKKGKSRPGRVKRAGASCNGSVTDLRARAKKYSGERAKMYHWCANMKSGKKK